MCSKLHIDLSLAFQLKPQHVGTVAMEFHKFLFPETDTVPPGRRGHLCGLRQNIFITGSPRNELNLSRMHKPFGSIEADTHDTTHHSSTGNLRFLTPGEMFIKLTLHLQRGSVKWSLEAEFIFPNTSS